MAGQLPHCIVCHAEHIIPSETSLQISQEFTHVFHALKNEEVARYC